MGDDTLGVSGEIHLNNSKPEYKDYDALITTSYAVFAIIFLLAIYAASMSPGTASGDLASMSVFP
jgi:hypothetical protein